MKKNKLTLAALLLLVTTVSADLYGQRKNALPIDIDRKGHFMVGLAFDVFKTDFKDRLGNKLQGSFEVNYFLSNSFSVTGGVEAWVDTVSTYSGVAGVRFYPFEKFFFRARGLIGVNEISAGAGFNIPLNERWTAEGLIDVYTSKNVALRVGINYLIGAGRSRELRE